MKSTSTSHQKRPPPTPSKKAALDKYWKEKYGDASDDEDPGVKLREQKIARRKAIEAKKAKMAEEAQSLALETKAKKAEEAQSIALKPSMESVSTEERNAAKENDKDKIDLPKSVETLKDAAVLLGQCKTCISGLNHPFDHPGAPNLTKGQNLTMEVELENEYDAAAVRMHNEDGQSCGYLSIKSEIKPILATILLQREHRPALNWLDRIEVTFKGSDNRFEGRLSIKFFGSKKDLGRLQKTMQQVTSFTISQRAKR